MSAALDRTERLIADCRSNGVRVAIVSTFDVENNAVRVLAAEVRRRNHHAAEVYFKDWISNHLPVPTAADLKAFVDVLRREDVALVAISIRASAYFESAKLLTRTVHEELGLAVLWGGMHPTLMGTQSIECADLLLQGEGELAFGDLCDRLAHGTDISDAPNTWVHTPRGVRQNELGPLVKNLDVLPFRDYTTHEHKYFVWNGRYTMGDPMKGDPVFQMMASRGCIYKCSFCYNSTYKKKVYPGQRWYRARSVDSALDEMVAATSHWNYKRVRFDDEVFNPNPDWVDEFIAKYPKRVGKPFEIFLEPKLVERDKLKRLRDAGLTGVFMGIQASERVTGHLYDRRADHNSIESIADLFHELGVHPHYQLIFDDPASTDGDRRALFEMISSFPPPFDLYLFSMTVFPQSELNRKLVDSGVISKWDIEGTNVRTFFQHRVNLRYPRPVEETFWIALIVMLSKGWMSRRALNELSKSEFLKKHPWPLIQAAQATNYVKMGGMALKMAGRGEMTSTLLRRWLSVDRVITA
jgi:radical SAM superfamily enzyme YgiQ (UPF0313 family)